MVSNGLRSFTFYQISAAFTYFVDFLGAHKRAEERQAKTDEQLANEMRDGDDQAFEQLYDRYIGKIYAFVARRVGSVQVAEDLTADVFMKAFVHRQRFVWKTSFSSWIYRIASNRLIDYYRAKPSHDVLDEEIHDRDSGLTSATELVDQHLLRDRLEAVIEKLSQREQMAVGMKYFGECSPQEIAEALQITPNNVGVLLHRALKKCHEFYDQTLV